MSRFKFGPEHVGKRVNHYDGDVGVITEINPDASEFMQMTINWNGSELRHFYSLDGIAYFDEPVVVSLDDSASQPAPAPTIQEIADEITERMNEADKITFRSETEEKLWLQCFTRYMGNTNATQYADNAVLKYRARMPKSEPQAVRVEDAPPHMIAYSRLMEIGEVEAAKRIMFMPETAKKRGWYIKYKYLHLWLFQSFDWHVECTAVNGTDIWSELYEITKESYIKMHPDEEQ